MLRSCRCAYGAVLDDTWIYDPNTNQWTQATPIVRPPARNQGHMYFDAEGRRGALRRYGSTVFNDLWTFDVATLKWTQQAMPAVNPGGVYLGQVAYATTTQCGYVVYGGSAAGATGGTWKLCLSAIGNQPPVASVRDRLDDGRVKIADWLGNRSVLGLEPRDAS